MAIDLRILAARSIAVKDEFWMNQDEIEKAVEAAKVLAEFFVRSIAQRDSTSDTLLNRAEIADYLEISPRALYDLIRNPRKNFPQPDTDKKGGRWHKSTVDDWLDTEQ